MNLAELIKQSAPSTRPNAQKLVEVAKNAAPVQPTKAPIRQATVKKDDNWVAHLTEVANKEFGQNPMFSGAAIELRVGKSGDTMVSLTPYLVYPDGTKKKPPYRANAGFCTNKEFGPWLESLRKLLEDAHSAVAPQPRSPGMLRKSVSYWTMELEKLAAGLNGDFDTQVVSGKLTVKYEGAMVCLEKADDGVLSVARGNGPREPFAKILRIFAANE